MPGHTRDGLRYVGWLLKAPASFWDTEEIKFSESQEGKEWDEAGKQFPILSNRPCRPKSREEWSFRAPDGEDGEDEYVFDRYFMRDFVVNGLLSRKLRLPTHLFFFVFIT